MKKITVGVVGAGPAGLTLANALLQRGHKVKLFERASLLKPALGKSTYICTNTTFWLSQLVLRSVYALLSLELHFCCLLPW